jgi:hypothetical protein
MKQILILEKTKDELIKLGYQKCSEEKYNQYKKDTANYATAISDDGKYFYKKKTSGGGGSSTTTYPSTGLNQTEGDAFRKWMGEKHSEFRCGKNNDEPLSNKTNQPYDNNCIRKAWKEFGEKYKDEINKPSSQQSTGGSNQTNTTQQGGGTNQTTTTPSKLQIDCNDRWTSGNYFETYDIVGSVSEFINWINSKKFYFSPGGVLHGLCGSIESQPYITTDPIHLSPLVKYMATKRDSFMGKDKKVVYKEAFDFWYNNVYQQGKQDSVVSDYKAIESGAPVIAELSNLFDKGTNIMSLLSKTGAKQPERSACKDLLDMYDSAYNKYDTDSYGMTRNNFINKMNSTKDAIFYCVKYHPGLTHKIRKFQRIANSDWAINLSSRTANKLTENNMKSIENSLRTRLVETKMVKSLKVQIHKKSLNEIADNFYSQNYRKFLTQIMEHTKSLQNSNGIITENVSDTFEKAFNTLFLGNESKMKEQTINHILRELKVEPSSKIGIEITNELNSTPDSEVTRLLSDPTYVADKISSAIDKSIESDNVTDDSLESMLKSSTVNKMRSTMDDVKFKIANRLTSVLDSARQNVERTSSEVKQSFIDKLSSKIAEF